MATFWISSVAMNLFGQVLAARRDVLELAENGRFENLIF